MRRSLALRPVSDRQALGSAAGFASGAPVTEPIDCRWRADVCDAELVALVEAHGGHSEVGWWDRIRPVSLGWVTARLADGVLIGFVNVAWDGGDHAFLIDTKVASRYQRLAIGTALVSVAVQHAKAAGCDWIHVDFEDYLAPFYFDACGFRPTAAGLIHLPSVQSSAEVLP
jgi:ribosomal protein S18 acetylase RimI-like enzyme